MVILSEACVDKAFEKLECALLDESNFSTIYDSFIGVVVKITTGIMAH